MLSAIRPTTKKKKDEKYSLRCNITACIHTYWRQIEEKEKIYFLHYLASEIA